MSEMISGVIEKIHGPNKGGFYSIKLEGDDRWFGLGKFPPKAKEREQVEFEFTLNGNFFNANTKSIRVMQGAPTPAASTPEDRAFNASPARLGKAAVAAAVSKDDYWRRREDADVEDRAYRRARDERVQMEIRYQAARNAAIEFLGLAMDKGLFQVPEASGNKKTSLLRSLKLQLDKVTSEFYEDTANLGGDSKPAVAAPVKAVEAPEEDF